MPTSSEHSLGATSLRHESWEFDSGARDLSPEPNALYKLIEAAGVSLTANPGQILEIANKVSYLLGTPIAVAGSLVATKFHATELGEIGWGKVIPYWTRCFPKSTRFIQSVVSETPRLFTYIFSRI